MDKQIDGYCEKIMYKNKILALIIHPKNIQAFEASGEKISFLTPDEFPFQVGIQKRGKEEVVEPHFHIPFTELKDFPAQEFLYILSGKARVDLYDENKEKVEEVTVESGDSIILNTGHGVAFLETTKFFNIKQGPYRGRSEEKISI